MAQQFGGSVLRDSLSLDRSPSRGVPVAGPGPLAWISSTSAFTRVHALCAGMSGGLPCVGRPRPRSTSIRFTQPTGARILMRASALNSRGVTTVRKSRRRQGLERGNLHWLVGRRGKKRRAHLARRGREHLRLSHVGGSRNDKDAQQRSSQKEHAVCLHAVQIYDRSKRNVSAVEFEVIAPP